jgi:hypothetical protein
LLWICGGNKEEAFQNPDYPNLHLVSSEMKTLMDAPKCGAPDLESISSFLAKKNSDNRGFCDHCFTNGGEGCETCEAEGDYEWCTCKESHRYGPALIQLDPRLNPKVKFQSLPP